MDGFAEQNSAFQKLNTHIIAASTDNLENSAAIAAGLPFPIAHGVNKEVAEAIGATWNDSRSLMEPTELVLDHEGKVLSVLYNDGPVDPRMSAVEVSNLIASQEE